MRGNFHLLLWPRKLNDMGSVAWLCRDCGNPATFTMLTAMNASRVQPAGVLHTAYIVYGMYAFKYSQVCPKSGKRTAFPC